MCLSLGIWFALHLPVPSFRLKVALGSATQHVWLEKGLSGRCMTFTDLVRPKQPDDDRLESSLLTKPSDADEVLLSNSYVR